MPDEERSQGSSALDELCRLHGVASEYNDIWGKVHRASDRTRCAVLEALGVLDRDAGLDAALEAHERETWSRIVPPVAVFRIDAAPYRMRFRFSERYMRATYQWRFELENGDVRMGEFRPEQLQALRQHTIDAHTYFEMAFDWNDRLPCGYHRYELRGPGLAPRCVRHVHRRTALLLRAAPSRRTGGGCGARPCSCIRFVPGATGAWAI